MGKTRSVWGNYFHLLSFKIEQNDEEKNPQYLKHLFLHPSLLPGLSFSPTFCPSGTGGQGMDSAVSLLHSQVIPHCLCCCFLLCGSTPYPLPLLKCVVPPTGDSPSQASPESFLRAPVLQEPMGVLWCHRSWSCMGSSPPGHSSCQGPAPAPAFQRVTASCRHPPALVWGSPWAVGGFLLHHGSLWAQEHSCLTVVFPIACRGTSAAKHGAFPPPPPSLALISA